MPCNFRHAAPSYVKKYKKFFDYPVHINQNFNGTDFDMAALDVPLPQADPKILADLRKKLDNTKHVETKAESIHRQALHYLENLIGKSSFSINNLALLMGMSERNLRRHLSAEGTSYRQQLELARKNLCAKYINEGEYSFSGPRKHG